MFRDNNGVLEKLRWKKRLSFEDVCSRIGVSRRLLSLYETGRCEVDTMTLLALCELYETPISYVYDKSPEELEAEIKISDRIKYYRKKSGLTQEGLGEKIGKSTSFVSDCENRYRIPSLPILKRMANVFDIPLKDLTGKMKIECSSFGSTMLELRELRGMSRRQVSIGSKVPEYILASYETSTQTPEPHVVKRVSDFFGVPFAQLNNGVPLNIVLSEMSIGERIRFYRKINGLTQNDLAQCSKVCVATVRNYEGEVPDTYSEKILRRFARVLDIPLADLKGDFSQC